MNSRQIIIDLIDKQIINGEQAFTLINDLLKAELLEAWDTLNSSNENRNSSRLTISDLNSVWINNPTYGISTCGTGYSTSNTASSK